MAACETIANYSFQALLIIAFIILISFKIIEWQDEAVGLSLTQSKNSIHLPSVTICPSAVNPQEGSINKTLREIIMIDPKKFIVEANYSINVSDRKPKQEGIISSWNSSFAVNTYMGQIAPCLTWNGIPATINSPQVAKFEMSSSHDGKLQLELHDVGHSTMPFQFNPETMQNFFEHHGKTTLIELKYSELRRLSTKRFKCDESGLADPSNCLQNYLEQKLNCKLPWNNAGFQANRECQSSQALIDLTSEITEQNDTIMDELQQTGCWINNCIEKKWSVIDLRTMSNNDNQTIVSLFLDTSAKAEIWQENRLYGFTNFIADFGGYLGLLLGSSMLSMTEGIINVIKKLKRN